MRVGFTLLECLTVVALIALLIAILCPSIAASRAQARRLSCAANLRAVGHAFNLLKTQRGHYPLREPPPPDPTRMTGLASIGGNLARDLVNGYLGGPEPLYCPSSLKSDIHAREPRVRVANGGGVIEHWKTGQISYIYLAGVQTPFEDDNGVPTFIPELEMPDNRRNPRVVLTGDRVVDLLASKHIPGSNHGRQGGWFYFTTGDAEWWPWDRLTAHPEPRGNRKPRSRIWYWPRRATGPSQIAELP